MFDWFKRLFNRDNSTPHTDVVEPPPGEPGSMEMSFVAFQPHNEIEQALMDAAVNPDARAAFHRALLDADLYAATPEAPAFAENRIAQEGERLSLLNVQGPDGAPVAAIFTAQERIVEVFGMDVGFVAIRGEELLSLVANQGAWLNPGFPYSVYWTPSELSAVLGKGLQRTIQKETSVMLGVPADPPTALVTALQKVLGNDTRITEAWLALAHWPEEGTASWYLDVRTNLAAATVGDVLAETFRRADYAGKPLDMVVNIPGGGEGVGIRVAPSQTH